MFYFEHGQGTHYAPPMPAGVRLRQAHQLREFDLLLNQHFRTKKTVRAYANRLSLTPNYLNALCRLHRNQTVIALIQQRVLVQAQRLLATSELLVKQIAAELGFVHVSYFSRFFRRHTGQTPEQFRLNR